MRGFSIIEAESLAEARSLAGGHPYLSDGGGNFSIEIYPMLAVPFET